MDTRPLGATGHDSTCLTFGAIALSQLEQPAANAMVELVRRHGINHFDVAPTYGDAELKLGPKLREHREDVFLGCKTTERDYDDARYELDRSLTRLGIDQIDLYQFHAVTSSDEIDEITAPDGALSAFKDAKDEGLVSHIGLTSHGHPDVILEAIDRIAELETVMFPMNPTVAASEAPEHAYERVINRCDDEGLGTIGIKAFAEGPWPGTDELPRDERPYRTWYEPVDTQQRIDECLNFTLSQGLTTITNAGDAKLLPMILDAATRYKELSADQATAVLADSADRESPVPR